MKVEIYGTPSCGYCVQARKMCEANEIEYDYIDLSTSVIEKNKLEERLNRAVSTVPQIFIDDVYLPGGYTALKDKII